MNAQEIAEKEEETKVEIHYYSIYSWDCVWEIDGFRGARGGSEFRLARYITSKSIVIMYGFYFTIVALQREERAGRVSSRWISQSVSPQGNLLTMTTILSRPCAAGLTDCLTDVISNVLCFVAAVPWPGINILFRHTQWHIINRKLKFSNQIFNYNRDFV